MIPLGHDIDDPELFSFEDSFFSLMHLRGFKGRSVKKARAAFNENRDFCRNHLRPLALKMDLKLQKEPDSLAYEYIELGARHRQFSLMIPPIMGGRGIPAYSIAPIAEETTAVCAGYQGLLGGHELGLAALMMTFNIKVLDWLGGLIVKGEENGSPVLIDCAITEPMAGSDVEEVELLPHAKLVCEAKRTSDGGAILNGRKVFISTGHFAAYHVVLMPFDRRDPVNTFACLIVPNDAKGFSLGKSEHKMGQKASPASELIFEDCHIPPEYIVMVGNDWREGGLEFLLEGVLGITRTVVGSMGTGVARGAFEKALAFAKSNKIRGRTIIQQQWAQAMLTDMLANVMMARSVYIESMFNLFNEGLMMSLDLPAMAGTRLGIWFMNQPWVKKILHSDWARKRALEFMMEKPRESRQRVQYLSSLAKMVGSDMGMENSHLMLEMMGRAGLRHESGAEKIFRDAKLMQIFEGTNQLNRLNQFKNFIARNVPGLEVF